MSNYHYQVTRAGGRDRQGFARIFQICTIECSLKLSVDNYPNHTASYRSCDQLNVRHWFSHNPTMLLVATITAFAIHRYPQHFFKFLTLPLTVVYYKVNYLPVGVRIWFWPNCRIRVFGDMANFSSEIG